MNDANVAAFTTLLARASRLKMTGYQTLQGVPVVDVSKIVTTESALAPAGLEACAAGYVAMAPEFHASEGEQTETGAPRIAGNTGARALAYWTDLPIAIWNRLIYGNSGNVTVALLDTETSYYGKPMRLVTPTDVRTALETYLADPSNPRTFP